MEKIWKNSDSMYKLFETKAVYQNECKKKWKI